MELPLLPAGRLLQEQESTTADLMNHYEVVSTLYTPDMGEWAREIAPAGVQYTVFHNETHPEGNGTSSSTAVEYAISCLHM